MAFNTDIPAGLLGSAKGFSDPFAVSEPESEEKTTVVPVASPAGQEALEQPDGSMIQLSNEDLMVFGEGMGSSEVTPLTALPKGVAAGTLRIGQSVGTAGKMLGEQLSPADLVPLDQMTPHDQMYIRGQAGKYVKDGMDPAKAMVRARVTDHFQRAISTDGTANFLKGQGDLIEKYWGDQAEAMTPAELKGKNVWDNPGILKSPTWWLYNVGEQIPNFAVSLGAGGAAVKGTRIVGAMSRMTPQNVARLARIGGAITGGAVAGGLESTATYRSVIEGGGSPDEALQSAKMMFFFSAGLNSISVGQIFGRMGNGFMSNVKKRGLNAVVEGLTEGAEEPAEVTAILAGKLIAGEELPNDIMELYIQSLKDAVTVMPIAAVTGAGAPVGKGGKAPKKEKPSSDADVAAKAEIDSVREQVEAKTGVKTKPTLGSLKEGETLETPDGRTVLYKDDYVKALESNAIEDMDKFLIDGSKEATDAFSKEAKAKAKKQAKAKKVAEDTKFKLDARKKPVNQQQWDLLKSGKADMSLFFLKAESSRDISEEVSGQAAINQTKIDAQFKTEEEVTEPDAPTIKASGINVDAMGRFMDVYGKDPFAEGTEAEAVKEVAKKVAEPTGKTVPFFKEPTPTEAKTPEALAKNRTEVQTAADAISKQLGLDIKVVDKLTPAMKRTAKARGVDPNRIMAARSKKTGTITMFAPNLNKERAVESAVHEVVHGTVRQHAKKLPAVYKANKAAIDALKKEQGIKDNMDATAEWLAQAITADMLAHKGKIGFAQFVKEGIVARVKKPVEGKKVVAPSTPEKTGMIKHKEETLQDDGVDTDKLSDEVIESMYDERGVKHPMIERMNQITSVRGLVEMNPAVAIEQLKKFNQVDVNQPSIMLMDGTEVFGPPIEGRNFTKWRKKDQIALEKSFVEAERIAREQELDPTDNVRGINLDTNWYSGQFISEHMGLLKAATKKQAERITKFNPETSKNMNTERKRVVAEMKDAQGLSDKTEKLFKLNTSKNIVGKIITKAQGKNALLRQYSAEELSSVIYEEALIFIQGKVRGNKEFNAQEFFGAMTNKLSDFAVEQEASKIGTTVDDIKNQIKAGTFTGVEQRISGADQGFANLSPEQQALQGTQADQDAVNKATEVTLDPSYQAALRGLMFGINKAKKADKAVMKKYKGKGGTKTSDAEIITIASEIMPAKEFNEIINNIDPDVLPSPVKNITPEQHLIDTIQAGPSIRAARGTIPTKDTGVDIDERLSEGVSRFGHAVKAEPRPTLPSKAKKTTKVVGKQIIEVSEGTPVKRRQALKEKLFGDLATMGDSRALEEHKEARKHLAGTFTQANVENAKRFRERRLDRQVIFPNPRNEVGLDKLQEAVDDLNKGTTDNVQYAIQHQVGHGYVIEKHTYTDVKRPFGKPTARLKPGEKARGHRGQAIEGIEKPETLMDHVEKVVTPPKSMEMLAGLTKTKQVAAVMLLQKAYLARAAAMYKILSDKSITEQMGKARQVQLAEGAMMTPEFVENTWREVKDKPAIRSRPVLTDIAHIKELRAMALPEHHIVVTTSAAKAAWGLGRNATIEALVSPAAHKALDANPKLEKKMDANGSFVWETANGNVRFIPAEQARIPVDFTRVKSKASKVGNVYVEDPSAVAARLKEDGMLKQAEEIVSAMVGKPRPLTPQDVLDAMSNTYSPGFAGGQAPVESVKIGDSEVSSDKLTRLINGTVAESFGKPIEELMKEVEEGRKSEHRKVVDDILLAEEARRLDYQKAKDRDLKGKHISSRQEKLIKATEAVARDREVREAKERLPHRKELLEAVREGGRKAADLLQAQLEKEQATPRTIKAAVKKQEFIDRVMKDKEFEETRPVEINKTAKERLLAMADAQQKARGTKKLDPASLSEGTTVFRYEDGTEISGPTPEDIFFRAPLKRRFQIKRGNYKHFTVKGAELKIAPRTVTAKPIDFSMGGQTIGPQFASGAAPSIKAKAKKLKKASTTSVSFTLAKGAEKTPVAEVVPNKEATQTLKEDAQAKKDKPQVVKAVVTKPTALGIGDHIEDIHPDVMLKVINEMGLALPDEPTIDEIMNVWHSQPAEIREAVMAEMGLGEETDAERLAKIQATGPASTETAVARARKIGKKDPKIAEALRVAKLLDDGAEVKDMSRSDAKIANGIIQGQLFGPKDAQYWKRVGQKKIDYQEWKRQLEAGVTDITSFKKWQDQQGVVDIGKKPKKQTNVEWLTKNLKDKMEDADVTTIEIKPGLDSFAYEKIADQWDAGEIDLTNEQVEALNEYWNQAQEIEDSLDAEDDADTTFDLQATLNNERGGIASALLDPENSPTYKAARAVYRGLKKFTTDKERVFKNTAKYLNVESNFKPMGALETGFHAKNVFSFQEATLDKYKREVIDKFNETILRHMPDATNEQLAMLTFAAEDHRYDRVLRDAVGEVDYEQTWKKPINFLRDVFEDAREAYGERGVHVNFVKDQVEKYTKKWEETEDWDKIKTYMKRLADLQSIEFIHIPSSFWAAGNLESVVPGDPNTQAFKNKVANLRKSIKGRRKLLLADLVKEGLMKTEAVNPYEILLHYGTNMAKDFSLFNIRDAGIKDGLIKRTKSKPTKNGPWVKVPEKYNALISNKPNLLRGEGPLNTYIRADLKTTLDAVLQSDMPSDKWGKAMNMYKMMQFYNPVFLPMYDVVQSIALAGALGKSTPSAIGKAFKSVMTHDAAWQEAAENGLFSKPFAPHFLKELRRARDQAQIEGRGYKGTLENYLKFEFGQIAKMVEQGQYFRAGFRSGSALIKPVMEASWNTAWALDGAIRLYTYHFLKKQGLNGRDAAQTAALAHGDYAGVPARTRRQLNRIFFTPTFKVAMARAHAELASGLVAGVKGKDFKKGSRGRQAARAGLSFIAFNLGVDMLFKALGYEPDKRDPYRRYTKVIVQDGKPREHVINFSHPANLLSKYGAGLWSLLFPAVGTENRYLDFAKRFRWDILPFAQDMLGLMDNRRPDGSRIYNTSDTHKQQALDVAKYMTLNVVPIVNDMVAFGTGKLTKGRRESQEHLGKLSHFMLNTIAFTYTRGTKMERMEKLLQRMERNLSTELNEELENNGEIRMDWMLNVQKRQIEVIEEFMKNPS